MQDLLKRLNWKQQSSFVLVQPPDGFQAILAGIASVAVVTELAKVRKAGFFLSFVTSQAQLQGLAPRIAGKADGDAIVWFAYPKGSSKRYKSELNRDRSWGVLGELGFEPVRQISIDEDWTALRFRRAEFIRTMRRDPARMLSSEGKRKVTERTRPSDAGQA